MIRKNTKLVTLLVVAVILAGCGMWTNFTTYFNRYYNAKEKFLEAEKIINEEKKELFEFRSEKKSNKARASIESVIEGCSKILQYNQESSYVNDALFLLGKAFYYDQKYLKAERKFSELFALGKSDLYLDSKLWLSKSKLQLRKFDLGLKLIDEVIDSTITSENEELLTDALVAKTSFYLFRREYENAISIADTLFKYSTSNELKAEVAFEIGRMYLEIEKNQEARKYFSLVDEYAPTFEIEVLSKLEVARIGSEIGKPEESLDLLEDMRSESKYEKYLDKIDLELGIVNLKLGNLEKSFDILTEVDTLYKKSETGGSASYFKGLLYEEGYGNIDSAIVYYRAAMYSQAPVEYRDIAREKEKLLKKYVTIKKEINSYYTKYLYLEDSTRYTRDSLEYERLWLEDSLKMVDQIEKRNMATEETTERALKAIKGIVDKKLKDLKPEKNTFTGGQLNEKLSKAQYEMGLYFFNDVIDNDSANYYFNEVLIHYPDSIKTPQLIYTLGSFYATVGDSLRSDSLLNYVYQNYNTELIANEAAKRLGKPLYNFDNDPAKDIFKIAEEKYDSGEYKEALIIYKDIYNNYKESSYAPKALLAASFIFEENIRNVDSVLVLYDSLSTIYPGTEYVKLISPKRQVYKEFLRARQDSINNLLNDSLSLDLSDSLKQDIPDSLQNIVPDSSKIKLASDSLKLVKPDSLSLEKPDSLKLKKEKKEESIQKKDVQKTDIKNTAAKKPKKQKVKK